MKAKKSLGQHFLNSPHIIDDIVRASEAQKGEMVLEIGPGEGILTKKLLEENLNVIAIEKDDRLIPVLQKMFVREIASRQLNLIHADVLDYSIPHLIHGQYRVVANIPYYITGQIIRMFLESDTQPQSMTLLVQKEVADRIVAKDDKESLLSLSVKVYGVPHYIRTVPRGAFTPHPNVDSAVIHINNISKDKLSGTNEKNFFELIHAGFAHKRKQLLPNLAQTYPKETILKVLSKIGIPSNARAEDIPIELWVILSKELAVEN